MGRSVCWMSAGGAYDLGVNIKGIVNQGKSIKLINGDKGEKDNNQEDGE